MILKNFHASLLLIGVILPLMAVPLRGWSQLATGSMDVHWNEGAQNCAGNTLPLLQVHKYNEQTFILRESLCSTFEAPFIYLLIGSEKALLIDTGDVADAKQMPLVSTVMQLLPATEHRSCR